MTAPRKSRFADEMGSVEYIGVVIKFYNDGVV